MQKEALRLFRELLPDREPRPGPRPTIQLRTRSSVATVTGEAGDVQEACMRLLRRVAAGPGAASWAATTPTRSGRGTASPP